MGLLDEVFKWLGYGRYNSAPPTIGDGQLSEFQTDINGNIKVNIANAGSLDGSRLPVALVASDTADFATGIPRAIVFAVSGTIAAMGADSGATATPIYVVAGTVYPYKLKRIKVAGTDAALQAANAIVGLY